MLFSVDVILKYQTYCRAIADGGEKEWDFAWQRYQNSPVASEKKNNPQCSWMYKESSASGKVSYNSFDG